MDRPIHPHPPLHTPLPPTPFDTAEYQPAEILAFRRQFEGIRAPVARPLSEHAQAINAGVNPQSAFGRPVPRVVREARQGLNERFRSGGFLSD